LRSSGAEVGEELSEELASEHLASVELARLKWTWK